MKKLFISLICVIFVLIAFGIFGFRNNKLNTKINADYLRIHIRANSNSDIDQKIKYAIKDAYIEYLTPKIAVCDTKEQVVNLVETEKGNLENIADNILKDNNFDYVSTVKICSEMFPARTYESYTLESGIYDAVIVELGKAQGNNWWCVIYPPLCFTNYSPSNLQNIVYKSKILEIIKQFFS